MSVWDEVCHHELIEDTSYRKKEQVLDHMAARSAQLWICKIIVSVTLYAKLHFIQEYPML
jgi:hypothetical protein